MPELAVNSSPDVQHNTGESDRQAAPGSDLRIRALATPFKRTSLQQLEDGDLLIKGVPMLAEGTWTDSAIQTPLFYPAKTLADYATNWTDYSGWNRHSGGVPRRGTDKVGEAQNVRYENGAVTADVRVYGFTQNGRDMQEMIKRKLISFVSVEHGGNERLNPATRQMEASTLVFHGFAFVNRGACKICKLNEGIISAPPTAPQEPATPPVIEESHMDSKELEAAIATAMAPVMKELEAVKAQKPAPVEIPKELTDAVKELSARIEKIEKQPAAPVAAPVQEPIKELGEVEVAVIYDRSAGTVRSV